MDEEWAAAAWAYYDDIGAVRPETLPELLAIVDRHFPRRLSWRQRLGRWLAQ